MTLLVIIPNGFVSQRLYTADCVKELTKVRFLLERFGIIIGALGGVGLHMTFERKEGICIYDINRDRIPQLCARY